jgi:hypothetical protein
MWISVPCGCRGSSGDCCHCGGLGFTWRISTAETQADSDKQYIEWMHCPFCSAQIHRRNFLAHLEVTHQTTWDAVERFVASQTPLNPPERPAQQAALNRLTSDSLKRISNELTLAVEHLIPRRNLMRLLRNYSSTQRQTQTDEAKLKIVVVDYLLP